MSKVNRSDTGEEFIQAYYYFKIFENMYLKKYPDLNIFIKKLKVMKN